MDTHTTTQSTTYTTITESASSDTITITSIALPDDIDVEASSTSQTYVLDRTNGLELDYSGVTSSSCTTTFVWQSSLGRKVVITEGGVTLATLGPTNTSYNYVRSCTESTAHLDLLVGDAVGSLASSPHDPKIKIIPPTC